MRGSAVGKGPAGSSGRCETVWGSLGRDQESGELWKQIDEHVRAMNRSIFLQSGEGPGIQEINDFFVFVSTSQSSPYSMGRWIRTVKQRVKKQFHLVEGDVASDLFGGLLGLRVGPSRP